MIVLNPDMYSECTEKILNDHPPPMKQYLEADNPPSGPCDLRKPNSIKVLSHPAARRNLDALVATKLIQVKT